MANVIRKGLAMRNPIIKSIVIDTLGSIDKGPGKRVVVRLMEANGWRYLDMRTFVLVNGDWQATGKGITLNKNNFDSFRALLEQWQEPASDALRAKTAEEVEKEMKKSFGRKDKPSGKAENQQAEFGF